MTHTPPNAPGAPELSESDYRLFSRLIYDRSGINLGDQKSSLVRARLLKRLRALGLPSFRKYYEFVTQKDATGQEQVHMLNAISTNMTQFFRDETHFDYLKKTFFPRWKNEPQLRILSAGCSTGEEPYSIAITAREYFGNAASTKVRINAGDICTKVLGQATNGVYRIADVRPILKERLKASFLQGTGTCEGLVAVAPEVKSLVEFRYLNLMEPLTVTEPFHAVFCRNVAIYFDRATQYAVFHRLSQVLVNGGTLFLGHSESMASSSCGYQYIQPAVYENQK